MHETLFDIPVGSRLSSASEIPIPRPAAGADAGRSCNGTRRAGTGPLAAAPRRSTRSRPMRCSAAGCRCIDSLIVCLQTLLSCGVGASVGLEAGYTQMGSAIASSIGRSFRLRRNDLRLMVGCGAAGAIGAAFNAPLGRRLLRDRTRHRHLYDRQSRAGGRGLPDRRLRRARPARRYRRFRSAAAGSVPGRAVHPDPGARHHLRARRHRAHARRHDRRELVPPQPACRPGPGPWSGGSSSAPAGW